MSRYFLNNKSVLEFVSLIYGKETFKDLAAGERERERKSGCVSLSH